MKLYAKIEKRLLNSFGVNGLRVQKEPNLTLPTLKNDLDSDSTNSLVRYVIYVTPKKLHAKKEEKLLKRFRDRPLPHNLDGRTDGRTDDRQSALEKLRCLSAGEAKQKCHL